MDFGILDLQEISAFVVDGSGLTSSTFEFC